MKELVYQTHIVIINICYKCFLLKDKMEFHPVCNKKNSLICLAMFLWLSGCFSLWDTSRRGNKSAVFRSQFELEST